MNLSLGTSLEGIKVLSAYDENNRIIKFSENPTNETNSHSEVLQRTFQDYDLSQFELSVRTRNVLEKEDINLLSELVSYNKYELLRMPNFGKWSLKEIEEFFSNLNLHLGMVLDDEDILSAYDENNRIIMFSENQLMKQIVILRLYKNISSYDLSQFEWSQELSHLKQKI